MEIDWAHVAVTAGVIALVLVIAQKTGFYEKGAQKFSWKLFGLLVVTLTFLNLLWPPGS